MPAQDLTLDNLTLRFGTFTAVDGFSLQVPAGRMVTLLGPSGCGKTTTLRMLAGLERPTSGRIVVGGRDITAAPTHERDIGMVFQSYALFPHLSVADNVAFGLVAEQVPAPERASRVQEALGLVGLGELGSRRPAELSGGQQQRVALARALVLKPALLLLDEPLSNLDAALRHRMRAEIRALQQRLGLTALYVTHDQEEALAVSDEIVLMRAGRIEQRGSPQQIVREPANAFVAGFIGQSMLLPAQVAALPGGEVAVSCGPLHLALPAPAALVSGDASESADAAWQLAVRPWALRLELGDLAEVLAVRYLGHQHEVDLRLPDLGDCTAVVPEPAGFVPAAGARCGVALHPRGCALVRA
ncbi:ABC transporter ATP-binding protein [Sphaerotilus microaerophilus]|uniref:Fe(3+) ions import ATP-binding protein FbpC 1 n=1 Tax=Sphaerotilus microaerophilus TaxID=2914710 RepID=A0ABM7YFU1_9BURK|nr:ABC transporter ATP-binding protein [Sphaerotilus sp. FB-5]BDI03119.1 Fe(3+) ions import ATP-binding protein FbpC 1 [Sphaerotilus sp. FB-5]